MWIGSIRLVVGTEDAFTPARETTPRAGKILDLLSEIHRGQRKT